MFKHGKPRGAVDDGVDLFAIAQLPGVGLAEDGRTRSERGVVTDRTGSPRGSVKDRVKEKVGVGEPGSFIAEFMDAIAEHRHWDRDMSDATPA